MACDRRATALSALVLPREYGHLCGGSCTAEVGEGVCVEQVQRFDVEAPTPSRRYGVDEVESKVQGFAVCIAG